MNLILKRIFAGLVTLVCSFSGCSPTQGNRLDKLSAIMNREAHCVRETVDALIPALQDGDAIAVLALFAENVRGEQPDLEAHVMEMLSQLDEDFEWHLDHNSSGGGLIHRGLRMNYCDFRIGIVSGDRACWLQSRLTYEHNRDKGEIGITAMRFIPVGTYATLKLAAISDEDRGLTVVLDAPSAQEGCFVGGYPAVWLDHGATLNEAELREFLSERETVTREAFENRFGSPAVKNARIDDFVGYVMPDENGEPRFALLDYLLDELVSVRIGERWSIQLPAIWVNRHDLHN